MSKEQIPQTPVQEDRELTSQERLGRRIRRRNRAVVGFAGLAGLSLAGIVAGGIASGEFSSGKEKAEVVKLDDLIRNPAAYKGKVLETEGQLTVQDHRVTIGKPVKAGDVTTIPKYDSYTGVLADAEGDTITAVTTEEIEGMKSDQFEDFSGQVKAEGTIEEVRQPGSDAVSYVFKAGGLQQITPETAPQQ